MKAVLSYLFIFSLFLLKGFAASGTHLQQDDARHLTANSFTFHHAIEKKQANILVADYVADDDEENDDEQETSGKKSAAAPLYHYFDTRLAIDDRSSGSYATYPHFAYTATRKYIFQRVLKI